jgi:hypothetical protein
MEEQTRLEKARIAYVAARLQKELSSDAAKKAGAAFRGAEAELVEAMLEVDLQNFTHETGLQCFLRQQFKVSITAANTQDVRDWLLETTGDDQPFVEEKLDKKAVEDHCKHVAETEGKDRIPDFLRLFTRPAIGVRGWEEAQMHYQKP